MIFRCILFLLIMISSLVHSQGLKFNGNEYPIDQRTSLSIFNDKSVTFNDNLDINFDLSIDYNTRLGHITRIKNSDNDVVYNFLYEGDHDKCIFWFNEEGKSNLITARFDKQFLSNYNWLHIKISFDLVNDLIKVYIQDQKFIANKVELSNTYKPHIYFGKSDYIIDVPSFSIQNLSISDKQKSYIFLLNESQGGIVHDNHGNPLGDVVNPYWLINDSYHWHLITDAYSSSEASSNYNEKTHELYHFNADSISVCDVKNGTVKKQAFDKKCPVKLSVANNFLDTESNRLYVYEVSYPEDHQGPTVASLDLKTYTWEIESSNLLNKELHHHGAFYNNQDSALVVFGGYGRNRYSGKFYQYHLNTHVWDSINDLKGDVINPRYFLSVGFDQDNLMGYVFGGMGNDTGEHIIGRRYFYDFYAINSTTNEVTKKWDISWSGDNVVPARNLIIADSSFYALCYPEHLSDSFLQLYEFSMRDGSFSIYGDSIPIYSDRITTNAKLYFDKKLNKMFASVQETKDDISSSLKVYSLTFPPISANQLSNYTAKKEQTWLYILICGIIVCSLALVFLINRIKTKKLKKKELYLNASENESNDKLKENSIYLFGGFTVVNKQSKDITYLFSARLQQAFCLILEYSFNHNKEGISSKKLSEFLWPDKTEDKVKNSRGVTINHLRKSLAELEGVELLHEKGNYKIVTTPDLYCDCIRCLQLITSDTELDENSITELLSIVHRGQFLKYSDHLLFDSLKTVIETQLELMLTIHVEKCYIDKEYQKTLALVKAIYNIDNLNDNALSYELKSLMALDMEDEAKARYTAFFVAYKSTMGTNYTYTFNELI